MSVRATDAAGNISSFSSVLVVTTPDTQAPTAPTGLASSNISQTSFTLSWTASSDNVGVTGYDVYQNGVFLVTVTGTTVGVSGLIAYTSYAMTVKAKDATNNVSAASAVLNVTTLDSQAPTTPTGLNSSNLTQSGFRLNWTASTDNVGVTGYYVYQNGTQIATVTTNTATITGLKASTSYIMTVRARDAAGNTSPVSTALTVTTPDTEAPTVPSGLTYSDLSQTGFTLTWNASTDNVNVTGYDVYRNGALVASVVGTAAGITNLSAFRTYTMTVRAKDAAGNISSASAVLNVTTPDTEGPTAPSGLTYTNLTQSGFTLNWTASVDNVGVTEYEVFHEGILLKSVTGTTAVLTGLKASKTYLLTVRAKDAAGNLSVPSTAISITTPDTEAPTSPTVLLYTNLTQSGFTLKWTASTDNVAVTEYEVYQNGVLVKKVAGTETAITDLSASRTYAMTVKAKDAAGNISAASAVLTITTPDTEAPTVPVGLTSKNISDTSFTLTWIASSDNVGVTGYEVYRNGELVATFTDTSAEINDLVTFKNYSMTVKAKDAAGNTTAASDALNVHTLDIHPPSAPAGVIASNVTDSSFTLRWIPSEDNVGVLDYEVYKNGNLVETANDTVVWFSGLNASTTYIMTVIAKDTAGNSSSASTALAVITPDTQSPSVPTDITSDNVTNKSFILEWRASKDNVGVAMYNLYQNDSLIAHVVDTLAIVSGLTANTLYVMTVRALDAAGNVSGSSNPLEITTSSPDNSHGIIVYPNPVQDNVFYVDLGMGDFQNATIELLDLKGNLMYKKVVDGTNRIVKMSDYELKRGIYFLRVSFGANVFNRKIMIDSQ
jgi:chitodextrinase